MAKHKILHIINIPWYSGLAKYAIDMARYMDLSGENVIFAVVGNSPLYRRLKGLYKVIPFPGRGIFNSIRSLFKIFKIRDEIKLVFAHTGSSCFIGLFSGIKVIRVRAEQGKVKKNIFNILIHKLVKAVIVPTEAIKRDFMEFVTAKDKIFFLPPVVDTEIFKTSQLSEDTVIAIVGRLDEVKGHRVLIESLPLIKKEFPDVKVVIAGNEEGVKWDELKRYAEKLNVEECISYKGYLTDEEIAEVMKTSRVGIIPSLGSEAVSRVALEWMASARPVVASNVGVLSEIVQNGYNGFIVEPNNCRQLSSSIVKILKDTELNVKMGKNALKYIEKNFSPSVYIRKLEILMKKLAERKKTC